MDFVYGWSPVLGAVGAVAVALLLVVGRLSPRRAALSLAVAAVVALLVELAAVFVVPTMQVGTLYQVDANNPLVLTSVAAYRVSDVFAGLLAIAAWALVLYAAAQAGLRARLVAFTLVLALVLVVQIALTTPQVPLLEGLQEWAFYRNPNFQWAYTLLAGLEHVAAVAALACAFFLPVAPTPPEAIPSAPPID
jgi:hypothetical protein